MCCTLMSSHANNPSIICQGTTRIFDNNSHGGASHTSTEIAIPTSTNDHGGASHTSTGIAVPTSTHDHGGTSHTSTGIAIPTSTNDHGGASHTSTGIELLTMPTSHFHCLFGLSGGEQEGDTEMSTIFSTDSDNESEETLSTHAICEEYHEQVSHHEYHEQASHHQNITVLLRTPAPGAECPISLDMIQSSEIPEFHGFVVNPHYPEHREIVLSCSHAFAANFLIISWLTSAMRCPLCRQGCDSKLDPSCLPIAWQRQAREYVSRLEGEAAADQLASDYDDALRSALEQTATVQLYMCAYIVHSDGTVESSVVQFSPNHNDIPENSNGDLVLSVSRASVRSVSGLIRRTESIGINLVVFAKCIGRDIELVEIANSGLMSMPLRLDDEQIPSNFVHPTRLVRMVQSSVQQDSSAYMGISRFSTDWQQYPNRVMDTLTQISFEIPFGDLAILVGGLFLVASTIDV